MPITVGSLCHYLVSADNFFLREKNKKKFLIAKLLRTYYVRRLIVCKLPHECEDITKNAWRTPLHAQCNIEYRLQYSLFFTFLSYHRNRLFYFFGYRFPTLFLTNLFVVSLLYLMRITLSSVKQISVNRLLLLFHNAVILINKKLFCSITKIIQIKMLKMFVLSQTHWTITARYSISSNTFQLGLIKGYRCWFRC